MPARSRFTSLTSWSRVSPSRSESIIASIDRHGDPSFARLEADNDLAARLVRLHEPMGVCSKRKTFAGFVLQAPSATRSTIAWNGISERGNVGPAPRAVTRGLDPRVHLLRLMDCRVKPGNDAGRLSARRAPEQSPVATACPAVWIAPPTCNKLGRGRRENSFSGG